MMHAAYLLLGLWQGLILYQKLSPIRLVAEKLINMTKIYDIDAISSSTEETLKQMEER